MKWINPGVSSIFDASSRGTLTNVSASLSHTGYAIEFPKNFSSSSTIYKNINNVILNGLQVQETPDSGYYLPLNLTVLENNQPVIKNLAIVPTDIDTEKNIAHITLDDGTKLTYPLYKKS